MACHRALVCTQVPGWWRVPGPRSRRGAARSRRGAAPSLPLQGRGGQAELVKAAHVRRRSDGSHRSSMR